MKSNKTTPVLQCHGDADPTVKYEGGVMTSELIKSFNPKNHEFKTFRGMGHSFCPGVSGGFRLFLLPFLFYTARFFLATGNF